MTEALWTADSFDYDKVGTDEIVRNALAVRPGGVILLHEGYETTLAAIPAIVKGLTERGLCTGRIVPSAAAVEAWPGATHHAVAAAW
jgi:peptidoglycan/xylan/chitin deacetylase (PgdA/CDA1 family)